MNRTNQNALRLREDSIFPHCSSDYTVGWSLAECSMEHLHYRLRILAVPEGAKNHDDGAVYIGTSSLCFIILKRRRNWFWFHD